jgi:uncharacterized membrane protein YfcA
MYFQSSGIEVSPWIPPCVAFAVSFITSMGGVSGAFLLLPFQISFLGYTAPSVSSTNQVYNIVAIPSGVYRFWREGRMVWPLTWTVIMGTLPGVSLGAMIRVVYLPNPKNFKLFAAGILAYIAIKLIRDLLQKDQKKDNKNSSERRFQELITSYRSGSASSKAAKENHLKPTVVNSFNFRRLSYSFYGETFDVSFLGIFTLCLIVGIAGGIYGIGGGAIISPFLVTFFGLPVYTVAGAALMGTFLTSVAGVVFYEAIAPYYQDISVAPDWLLGGLFGLGGIAGMYLGAYCQKFVPAKLIKWMLSLTILATAIKYIGEFYHPNMPKG